MAKVVLAVTRLEKVKFADLDGDTLKDIEKSVNKKGPKDQNGKRQYAVTECWVESNIFDRKDSDKRIEILSKITAPVRDEKIRFGLQNVTLFLRGKLEYCAPKNYRKLSKPAKKEWDRFFRELMRHEGQHFTDGIDLGRSLERDLKSCTVEVKIAEFDPSDRRSVLNAKKAAAPLLIKKISDIAKGNKFWANAKRVAFDIMTKHGATTGARLDTSIE